MRSIKTATVAVFVAALILVTAPAQAIVAPVGDDAAGVGFNTDYESVAYIRITPDPDKEGNERDPFVCTGVLVAPDIVLTAATCFKWNNEPDGDHSDDIEKVVFGTSAAAAEVSYTVSQQNVNVHRYYDPELGGRYDLALIRLNQEPGIEPATFANFPLVLASNALVTIVGFGEQENYVKGVSEQTAGSRLGIEVPSRLVRFDHFQAGIEGKTTCRGDSGAPVFLDPDGPGGGLPPQLIAITAGQFTCFENVQRIRLDLYADTFIFPYIDAFHGNGPPADPCAWLSGECEENCPSRDWDCPLGAFVGDACDADGQCEGGGRCVSALDDPNFNYCTQPCEIDNTDSLPCPGDMTCKTSTGGANECSYGIPSRGSQGWSCSLADECRSNLCEGNVCVNDCVLGQDLCPEGTICAQSTVDPTRQVCRSAALSGGGGFCAVNPGQASSYLLFLGLCLVFAGVGFRRRRR